MSQSKIPSANYVIIINAITVIVLSFAIVYFFDFTFPEMDVDHKRRLGQAATFINIFAALFLSYKFIQSNRYKQREVEIFTLDNELSKKHHLVKFDVYTEKELNNWADKINKEREKLYQELQNIFDLGKLESAHIVMGLILVVISSSLQMISAG